MKFYIGILSFLFTTNIWAFQSPIHNGFVTDRAGIFSEEEEILLTTQLQKIEREITVEIAILSVKTTNNIPIFDYALQAAETWGVGKSDTDNGLFILIASEDRKYQILTGYGLENTLPDNRVDQIIRKHFPPNFRKKLYYQGVTGVLTDINGFLIQEPSIISEYEHVNISHLGDHLSITVFVAIIMLFILNVLSIFNNKNQPERTAIASLLFGIFAGIIFSSILAGIIAAFFLFIWGNLRGTGGINADSSDGFGNSDFGSGSFGGFGGGFGSGGSGSSFGGGSFGGGGSSGSW